MLQNWEAAVCDCQLVLNCRYVRCSPEDGSHFSVALRASQILDSTKGYLAIWEKKSLVTINNRNHMLLCTEKFVPLPLWCLGFLYTKRSKNLINVKSCKGSPEYWMWFPWKKKKAKNHYGLCLRKSATKHKGLKHSKNIKPHLKNTKTQGYFITKPDKLIHSCTGSYFRNVNIFVTKNHLLHFVSVMNCLTVLIAVNTQDHSDTIYSNENKDFKYIFV